MLILHYVSFELSYDKFHTNYERIYRVRLDQYKNGEQVFKSSENYPGVGPALTEEFPEVIANTRLYNLGAKNNMVVMREDAPAGPVEFKTSKLLYADSSFLQFFSYKMVQGNPETALAEPFSMVITESIARNYFSDEDPIGKMLRMRDDDFNDENCKITGVIADMPQNTHLKFDYLISYKTLFTRGDWAPARYDTGWGRKDMYTYIQLRKETNPEELETKFPAIVEKYNPDLQEQSR